MDHHEDGDQSDEISVQITFLKDGRDSSPQCGDTEVIVQVLAKNKDTERDQYKKSLGCLSTRQ